MKRMVSIIISVFLLLTAVPLAGFAYNDSPVYMVDLVGVSTNDIIKQFGKDYQSDYYWDGWDGYLYYPAGTPPYNFIFSAYSGKIKGTEIIKRLEYSIKRVGASAPVFKGIDAHMDFATLSKNLDTNLKEGDIEGTYCLFYQYADKDIYFEYMNYPSSTSLPDYVYVNYIPERTPKKITVPSPTGLKVTATDTTSLNLKWNKVSDATGYEIHQFNPKTKGYKKLGAIKTNSYQATNLTPVTTYYYSVRAYKTVDGKTYYSDFSTVLKAKTKGSVPRTQQTIPSENGSIKCTFMYGFDISTNTNSMYYVCEKQLQRLSSLGMTTNLYNAPTVEDYINAFRDSDYICIFEHGTYIDSDGTSYFVVRGDKYSKEKYKDDIDSGRLKAWSLENNRDFDMIDSNEKLYFISPDFIKYHYDGNKLNNTVVYLFCCKGFGVSDSVCLSFAKAFEACGASATIGFCNEVEQVYGRYFFESFTTSLLNGKTIAEAFDSSVKKNEKNDYEFIKKYGPSFENWDKPLKEASNSGYNTWKEWLADKENNKNPGKAMIYGKGGNTYLGVPNSPAKLKVVKQTDTTVQLSWSAVPKAKGYVIYQYDGSSKKYKKLSSTKSNSYTVKGLTPGSTYRFIIKSYRTLNKKTILSEKFALANATTLLAKPTLTVEAGKGKAVLSWDKVKGANKYSVFVAKSKNGKYSLLKTTTERKATVNNLKSGKTYYFRIRAFKQTKNAKYYSNYSKVKAVTIQ